MQELKRVYKNPFWYTAFIIFAVVNILLFIFAQKNTLNCSFVEYAKIDEYWNQQLEHVDAKQSLVLLEREKSILIKLLNASESIRSDDNRAVELFISENPELKEYVQKMQQGDDLLLTARINYINDAIDEFNHILTYPDYMDMVVSQADSMKQILSDKDDSSFELKNIDKTVSDFSRVNDIVLKYGNNRFVASVVMNDVSTIFCVAMMLITILLFFDERRKNIHMIVCAAPAGTKKLFFKRAAIIAFSSILTASVFYLSLISASYAIYGQSVDFSSPIRSVPMFIYFPERMSTGSFLILFGLFKALSLIVTAIVFWMIFMWIKNRSLAFVVTVLVFVLQYVPFVTLNKNYSFGWLNSINLITMATTIPIFTRYVNLSIFGLLIAEWKAVLYSMIILIIIVGSFCLIGQVKLKYVHNSIDIPFVGKLKSRFFGQQHAELRKIFVYSGVTLLLIIHILITWHYMKLPQIDQTLTQEFVEIISTRYSGPVNDATLDFLKKDRNTAFDNYEFYRQLALKQSSASYQLEYAYAQLKAVDTVIERAEKIYATGNDKIHLMGTDAYENIFGDHAQSWRMQTAALAILFLILSVSHQIGYEMKSNMQSFIRTVPKENKVINLKLINSLLTASIIWITVTTREVYLAYERWNGFQGLFGSGLSLSVWKADIFNAPIILLLSYTCFIRLIAFFGAAMIILYISSLCDSYFKSVIISFSILLLPLLISFIPGLEFVSYLSYTGWISDIVLIPDIAGTAIFIFTASIAAILTIKRLRSYSK